MSLDRLNVRQIRNLSEANLVLDKHLNLFVGTNGSGKTSLLEAVYFLATGRSFRSTQIEPVIQHSKDSCTVFGVVHRADGQAMKMGVHRTAKGQREVKIDGVHVNQMSTLARELPLLVLGPETVDLVQGSPAERRKFLNHGVFHVEHDFGDIWRNVNRCLRQRNQLLRDRHIDQKQISSWTTSLIQGTDQLDKLRIRYHEQLAPVFSEICRFLSGPEDVKCDYWPGWDRKKRLEQIMVTQQESDKTRGFTQSGFHRADLRITIKQKPAAQVCSRGELKILAWSLVLAQGALLQHNLTSRPVYLVDDLVSELDEFRQQKVAEYLSQDEGQVLVTGTDENRLKALWNRTSSKVFHVEQGKISERES